MRALRLLLCWGFYGLAVALPVSGAEAQPRGNPRPILHLTNEGFVVGDLVENPVGPALRWQSPVFTRPFDFTLAGVNAVHFPALGKTPQAEGEWLVELHQGTVLYGSIVGWSGNDVEINTARMGKVHVPPANIRRFHRLHDDGDIVYQGPSGTAGWDLNPPSKAWREDLGNLATDQEGVATGQFGLPARAAVEFVISWTKKPDFVFSLGVGDSELSVKQAFRFEVWGSDLVVHRELDNAADPAEIQPITPGAGRTHLQVFLDQNLGRCLVFSAGGNKLADIQVKADKPKVYGGVRLENLRSDVRLEQLRISKWTGDLPREVKADQPRVEQIDGSVGYGVITRFDPTAREFILKGESGEIRIPAEKVEHAVQSFSTELENPAILVGYHDGMKVGGELQKIAEGALWMTAPTMAGTLRLPLEGLRSIIVLRQEPLADTDGTEPVGTLEADGIRLRGRLEDGVAEPGSTCLVWHPIGSETASHLRSGVSGRIVYREPPPPKPAATANPNGVRQGGMLRINIGGVAVQQPNVRPNAKPTGQPSLYLRTGDTIPCEVTRIDENGVTFKTSFSDSAFVPHSKIKAVELIRDPKNSPGLTAAKRTRLLTLPRMQRGSPPTHLVRSTTGDYLRCRIIELNDQAAKVEVRLETKEIPRDRIARIIWLHSEGAKEKNDESDDADDTPIAADKRDGRMQVLRSDGIRLTFVPTKFAEAALIGNSEILGDCRVPMKQIDQLLVGSAIEKAASELAYQKWKLQNAVDPKFANGGEDGDGGEGGTESALVGKPAPTFELDLLNGERFKLASLKGKVVVLDFWATWCGPCLMAMPQVDRAARAFADQGVQLIAVNLEEAPKPIKSMLERHKLDLTVALDRDGAVAAKYQANAIPQTVIIDQEGVVSRVFIGGNAHLEEQIREALQKLLPSAAATDKTDEKPSQ